MLDSPTKIIFLWHMHQPYYKYPDREYFQLPWVRLHAVKDYYGMAKIVEKFEKIKVVVNFSGVLLKQLDEYVNDKAQDYYQILSLRNPKDLSTKEKQFIVDRFFSVNFERFIRSNKRYLQLYNKKLSPQGKFSDEEISDLQVLFNLCWLHPYTINEDKNIGELFRKEKEYTQEDKTYIIDKHYKVMQEIFPLYKRLSEQGKVELTVTPFYHPILPLLYDTQVLDQFPYLTMPRLRYQSKPSCKWHITESKKIFKKVFNYEPLGSWPAEGSLSETVIPYYQNANFNWVATDEAILFKSLSSDYVTVSMLEHQRHLVYRPYSYKGVNIFFRDRNLSDTISFIYQGWDDAPFAAADFIEHCKRIHYFTKNFFKDVTIPIIMDGENAWEYYRNNGVDFLENVYAQIERSDMLETTTPSELLKEYKPRNLDKFASGSWINADFGVWIGNKENNKFWEILAKLREFAQHKKLSKKREEELTQCLFVLESSDWYWWNTFEDGSGEFRRLFFAYVEKAYALLGKKLPKGLAAASK